MIRTALQIDWCFEQIRSLVKQLPMQQKVKLSKALGTKTMFFYNGQFIS
jgi:hypothetical protein